MTVVLKQQEGNERSRRHLNDWHRGHPLTYNTLIYMNDRQMCCFHTEQDPWGRFTFQVSQVSREDAIELANFLSQSDSEFIRRFGIEIESELMEAS